MHEGGVPQKFQVLLLHGRQIAGNDEGYRSKSNHSNLEGTLMKANSQIILLHEISKLGTSTAQWEPYAWYKEMRENTPVYYDAEQDVWNVFL